MAYQVDMFDAGDRKRSLSGFMLGVRCFLSAFGQIQQAAGHALACSFEDVCVGGNGRSARSRSRSMSRQWSRSRRRCFLPDVLDGLDGLDFEMVPDALPCKAAH